MAAGIGTCRKEQKRSVICFLVSEGVKRIEVHRQMKVRYGDACLSQQQVYEWSRKFRNGVMSNLGVLPPTTNKENKQGMASFLITKIQEVLNRINAVPVSIRTSKYECIFLITAADQLSKCNGSKLKFLIYLCRLAR
ncbi:hypothetical protein B7P43_G15456 [Cryptotermes secundus]|uniref:Mos1 transposase HTH domain-containing protein n=1 Tax=Cryptotermes secundus TaxID=105785 RepID=A0A2J7PV88_9NEOP|nr:hypothetical protein B7P43_G15456 [Cryptotermes secundus]